MYHLYEYFVKFFVLYQNMKKKMLMNKLFESYNKVLVLYRAYTIMYKLYEFSK